MGEEKEKASRNWLVWFAEHVLLPAVLLFLGVLLTSQFRERHDLSITVLRSGEATEVYVDPFLEALAGPEYTPTPGPESEYTYTVIVRNDGDFGEENVAISIGYHSPVSLGPSAYDPVLDLSSPLLASSVRRTTAAEPGTGYGLQVTRLNPGEWISMQVAWRFPAQVSVQVRSDTITDSAFVG